MCQTFRPTTVGEAPAMRLMAEIKRSPDGRLEGTIRCGDAAAPIEFSGVLDLLRILEDEVPPAPAAAETGPGRGGPSQP